jgi:hypothetical protein
VPNLVTKQLAIEMAILLEEEMASKKIEAEAKVMKEKNQSRYFYTKLKEIREQEEIRKNKNPIRRIGKAIGASFDEDDTESSSDDSDF